MQDLGKTHEEEKSITYHRYSEEEDISLKDDISSENNVL